MANYNLKVIPESMEKIEKRNNATVHISETNSKLGCIPSFNLLPMVTCSATACRTCLKDGCYAVKNLFRCGYDVDKNTTLKAWTENTVIAKKSVKKLEKEIIKYLQKKNPHFFRIHSSGDFFSVEYANMWFRIAKKFPETKFLAFTKQWDIIRKMRNKFYKLSNFSLVLSGWTNCEIPEDLRKNYYCAWCNDGQETRIPENAIMCPGNCETCGMCWNLKDIERDTYFNKH